jgi:curved DNA-binding protein CbpA
VAQDATQGEIRKAYRKLSMQWHPDKNKDPGATDKFAEIGVAYEAVGTPDKRAMFDDFGEKGAAGFDSFYEYQKSGAKASQDLYQGEQYVTRLTDATWDAKVKATDTGGATLLWVIEFYAPWCSHCVKGAPDFKAAAEKMDGEVEFGAVNCIDNKALCQRFGVNAYPSVFMFSPRFDMHAQYVNNAKKKWSEEIPKWAHESSFEWERLFVATNATVLTTLNFDQALLADDAMWLVRRRRRPATNP